MKSHLQIICASAHLLEMLCSNSQDMLVLSSTVASRYYNCHTYGSTSPGNYGYQWYMSPRSTCTSTHCHTHSTIWMYEWPPSFLLIYQYAYLFILCAPMKNALWCWDMPLVSLKLTDNEYWPS
jgi:hypothetical protein